MRMCKKKFLSACMALAIALLIPSINVYAADTYTVTFRPGNVGYFQEEAVNELVNKYGEANVAVTAHGAIKVTVNAGSDMPAAPTYIQPETGYFVKEVSAWGPNGGTVDRDVDFVVDYARLVDGVEYTVEYVDSASGESIAPIYITQANIGEDRTVNAPAQIVISGGAIYNLSSAASMTLTLDADASKNVFTFEYTLAPSGTVVEEVIIGEDGQIVTTTDYVTTTINNGTAVIGGGVAGGEAAGGAGAENAEAGGNEGVEIIDEETPLSDTIIAKPLENEPVEIGEEEVPLSAGEEPFANMAMIGASVFAVGAALVAALWLFMKKKRSSLTANETEE